MSAQGTPTGAQRVSAGRVPLFCDTALAGRVERVEAQLIARSSEAARRRAGTAGFDGRLLSIAVRGDSGDLRPGLYG